MYCCRWARQQGGTVLKVRKGKIVKKNLGSTLFSTCCWVFRFAPIEIYCFFCSACISLPLGASGVSGWGVRYQLPTYDIWVTPYKRARILLPRLCVDRKKAVIIYKSKKRGHKFWSSHLRAEHGFLFLTLPRHFCHLQNTEFPPADHRRWNR